MYWSIDNQKCAWDHRNIKLYHLHFVIYLFIITQWWIDRCFYFYVDQFNGSLIVWWLIKNQNFFWQFLKILLIIKVDQLLVTWKMVDRMLQRMWDNFSRWALNFGFWKGKKMYYNLCTKLKVCRKYQRKTSSLNLIFYFF